MNVYYITDIVLDNTTVHTIHITEICTGLVALGNSLTLYAPSTTKFQPTDRKYYVNFILTPHWMLSVFYQIHLFFRLCHDVFAHRPDVMYSRHSQHLFVPALVGRLFKIPVILEVNGKLIEETSHIANSKFERAMLLAGALRFLESFNFKLASAVIVVAAGIKNYLVQIYDINSNKITVIPNGVNTKFLTPLPVVESRVKIGLDERAVYVGYIGSLHVWQGLRFIAEAARLVCAQRPNVKFLIVGDGDEAGYLSSFIKDAGLEQKIELRPAVSHELVPTYINALDICLSYPTKFRSGATSPFKVYEYLACGKPVVSSDIAGMREEFGDAVAYAAPESPEALASALISLIDDKGKRNHLGVVGRAFVEQGHSWKAVARQTMAVLDTVA